MKIFNYDIRLNTFFKKGLPRIDDRHGVYFITGRQGTGKNYYAVMFLLNQSKSLCNKIYTNIKSLHIPGYDIIYFNKVQELYMNVEEHCIFVIDEISRKYKKTSPTDDQFYAWLNQSRKRKRIVLLLTQEWRELPMWIRRPAKYMITTSKNKLLNSFGLFITTICDAENMVFNKDEGEYECPPIIKILYKRNKSVADLYDTFEPINSL